ncbi:MAG: TetR/AcrR family transcriptional regulator [Lysobacterales bacterium]
MTNTRSADGQARKRPGPSGDPDIREGILDAAEDLFAKRGFAATSIREIADRVDVNAAMVHYYFGSKKKLLRAVMERVLEPMAGALANVEALGDLPVRELTRLLFAMATEHPSLPQLITREVLLPGGELQAEFLEHFAPRLGGRLPGILRREQDEGRLAADFDPQIMALLMLSLCVFPFIARPAAESVLGVRYDRDGLQALSEHVAGLLERGLRR